MTATTRARVHRGLSIVRLGFIAFLAGLLLAPCAIRAQDLPPRAADCATRIPAGPRDSLRVRLDSLCAELESAMAREDSVLRRVDSILAVGGRVVLGGQVKEPLPAWKIQERMATKIYAGFYMLGAGVNGAFKLDVDSRAGQKGAPDPWIDDHTTDHLLTVSFLTSSAIATGVPRWRAAAIGCAGGALFELSQRFVSRADLVANCGGALLTAGVDHLRMRMARALGRIP